jgi:hypothetical protein
MSDRLEGPLGRLFELVRGQGLQSWAEVKFVFLRRPARVTAELRDVVSRSEIIALPQARTRFDQALSTGCSWIRLACAGLLGKDLLVLVSQSDQRYSPLKPGRTPDVDVAGMERRVVDASFNALAAVDVNPGS